MKNLTLILASLALYCASIHAAVDVEINQSSYHFSDSPRLDEVLAPVAQLQQWYWPATKLFRLGSDDIEKQRRALLAQIDTVKLDADAALQIELSALQRQIESWQLAQRITIPVNYDLARVQQQFNPRFEAGTYKLLLVERPQSVYFWGAIKQAVTVPHLGGAAIAEYLVDIPRSAFADASYAVILQPDGKVIKTGIAAWNQQHIEAMPGAQVFIPFTDGWFGSDIEALNQNLLLLSLHRIE